MEPISSSWRTRHGDSSRSPVWAVVADDGTAVNLANWNIRAQLRASVDADSSVFTFTLINGITLGTAEVKLSTGRRVTTSTVQLYLLPSYFSTIPRPFSGLIEVEVSSDNTSTPLQRYTLVQVDMEISKDVTR